MSDDEIIGDRLTFTWPKPKWELKIADQGGGIYALAIQCQHAPNRFHRWTQRVVLGFNWERLP